MLHPADTEKSSGIEEVKPTAPGRLHISVLVSMPSPSRQHRRSMGPPAENEKAKYKANADADDETNINIMLGTTIIPFTKEEG